MIDWPDTVILYSMYFHHTGNLKLRWTDGCRKYAISLKAKTSAQTMLIVNTGKL